MDLPGKAASVPQAPYFTATPWKLVLMSFCTFGFYEYYWFYQNWKRYKKRTGEGVMPGWRATFSPVWAYSAFKDIRQAADAQKVKTVLDPARLAAGYILLFCAQFVSGYLGLAAIFTFVPIVIAGKLASAVNAATVPGYRENDRLSVGNWIVVIIGGSLNVGDKLFHPENISLEDLVHMNKHLFL